MLKNMRIGVKLIVVGTLIMVIPAAVIAFLAVSKSTSGLTSVETEQLARGARLIAGTIDGVFLEEKKLAVAGALDESIVAAAISANERGTATPVSTEKPLASMARGKSGSSPTPEVQDTVGLATKKLLELKNAKGLGEMYETLMCVGANGFTFAASDPAYVGVDFSDRAYIKTALAGTTNAGAAVISKVSNKPVVPIAAPIRSAERVIGAYVLILDAQFLNDLVKGEKIGTSGYAYVVDNTGLIIAHPVAANIFKTNLAALDGTREFTKKMIAGESGVSTYVFQGVAKTAGYAPVKDTGWSVGLTIPDVEYLAAVNEVRNLVLLIAAIAVVLAFLIYLAFSRTITKPLGKGVAFAELVASGDFTQQLPIRQRDEIGKLAQALNGMATKLKGMVATIQDSAEQVASSSEQITSSAQQLSEGAQSQASTLEETSASVEELTASVDQVAEHAQSQAAAVEQGSSSMAQVHQSIEDVSKNLAEIAGLARQVRGERLGGSEGRLASGGRDQPDRGQLGEDRGDHHGNLRHCRPDEPVGAQRLHRGRTRRRAWPGLCRCRRRGEQARRS